ncbi:hypothetical protein [Marinifilum sp. D714]|uniref:hypothetical protein n=1 Tax=Marinifilum sp. D714 TaxID=2937523 RepID=UPI0027C095F2|nr:hypothetical protein [Marinifilum sp. D714]MDQ2180841.1 hypothetical protein [Marinifilum sp. D714]
MTQLKVTKPTVPVKFHLFNFSFTPHKENVETTNSSHILKQSIQRINDERTQNGKAIVIDRHEGRTDEEPRNLFIISAAYLAREKKYKCKMALIRDNKIPTLVDRKDYALTPFNQLGNKAIAETTNFYIDLERSTPVVCCEYNYHGPRISDIEFYFRYISSYKMLCISKACKAEIHMKRPINYVLDSISDVLRFKIRTRPDRLKHIYNEVGDAFITNMTALAGTINPKSIVVDAIFKERGKSNGKKNGHAVSLVKKILKAIKDDNKISEEFEDFYLQFEKENGKDEVFNLMKGKQEITINCQQKTPGNLDTKDLFEKTNTAFNEYLNKSLN